MSATERLLDIATKFSESIKRIVPVELDGETLRLIIYLKDETNLRVAEQWSGSILERYSYYWLTPFNELKIGWDNAPHHTRLQTYPYHKHVDRKENLQPSSEMSLEEVMKTVLA